MSVVMLLHWGILLLRLVLVRVPGKALVLPWVVIQKQLVKIQRRLAMVAELKPKTVLLLDIVQKLARDIPTASLLVQIVLRQLPIRWPSVQVKLKPSMERK